MGRPLDANKILQSPLGPGFSRTCPSCFKRFALELEATRDHPIVKQVEKYRCKACGHEVEFAKQQPPNAI